VFGFLGQEARKIGLLIAYRPEQLVLKYVKLDKLLLKELSDKKVVTSSQPLNGDCPTSIS
jgi:hypothetical protein